MAGRSQTINVGMIGYQFMGKAHSHAFKDVGMFFQPRLTPVMKVICGRTEGKLREAAELYGWEQIETDWERLVARDDVDLVDIAGPNWLHAPAAIAAARAGKHILLEKPMATSVADAEEMVRAVEEAGVIHMIGFNYRRVPAVGLAKRLIEEGWIGEIRHYRGTYLQDWLTDESIPLIWKIDKQAAGSGAHGDLNAHQIDLARWLVGEIEQVVGMTETFIPERLLPDGSGRGTVEVDDAACFLARFGGGALGTFEATRLAPGRKNHHRFEINGSEGSLAFHFERMNELQLYSTRDPEHARGFRTILATEEQHPYIEHWWPPGHVIGYEQTFVNEVYDLLECIADGRPAWPSFHDGLANQRVLAGVERSVETGAWEGCSP
jgi:predicted dehydrogenase